MTDQTGQQEAPKIASPADLFAVAYQIEVDAVERYQILAGQMDSHNNPELAAVFRDLARAEGIHAAEIRRLAGGIDVEAHARQVAKWNKGDSPESADLGGAHYLMTRAEALQMALAGEERALAYFTHVFASLADEKMKAIAKTFIEEESEHVELCHRLIRKYQDADAKAAADPDPAISQG
jgi:rubrerythrin